MSVILLVLGVILGVCGALLGPFLMYKSAFHWPHLSLNTRRIVFYGGMALCYGGVCLLVKLIPIYNATPL